MEWKCSLCGNNEYRVIEDKGGIFYVCERCGYVYEIKPRDERYNVQQNISSNIPKCPTCGSANIKKITAGQKLGGMIGFGIFSKTARSQFECKNCGYKW